VPFKYKPTPKPRSSSTGKDERLAGESRERTSFTWADIRELLVASIGQGTVEGRYESLVEAVSYGEDWLDLWSSLRLIRWWWWPARSEKTGGAAAGWLRAWIRHELEMGEEYYTERAAAASVGVERTEFERRARLLASLASDPSFEPFAAPLVVEMASYDPLQQARSPYRVLSKILDKRLTPMLGAAPGSRSPKPTDFGRELTRLFRLPSDDRSRKRLESCLLKLAPDERALFELRYRDDVKHEAVQTQKRWSDGKIDAIRKSAVEKLCVCMPQMIVFVTPSRKN
jgi:hypothetical protein